MELVGVRRSFTSASHASEHHDEGIDKAPATVAAAESALAGIERHIEELAIRAPAAGIVEALTLRSDDLVTANAPTLSPLDPARFWIRTSVPERRPGVS